MSRYYLGAFLLGFLVTLGLFWLMQIMILNPETTLKETDALKMVEFVRLKHEDEVVTRKRVLPEKPMPQKKPPPPKMKVAKSNPVKTAMPNIDMPNLDVPDISPRIDGALVGGLQMSAEAGSGSDDGSGGISTDLVPIFRIPPQYPMRAAKRRIEGWVRVEFTIDAQGGVVDPEVVESYPNSMFNRSALAAVSKWKFKPKIIDGVAVEQRAVQLLEFKLSE